jgi:hypothetical protein
VLATPVGSVADPDPHYVLWDAGSGSGSNSKADPHPSQYAAAEVHNGAMDGRRRSQWRRSGLKWSRGGSLDWTNSVAESHHFDEEQDPDPDPHYRQNSDPDLRRSSTLPECASNKKR